jgi:hypothetical protein
MWTVQDWRSVLHLAGGDVDYQLGGLVTVTGTLFTSGASGHHRPLRCEPISKSPEEDNEASELYEAEEVLGVVFPTDEDATLPLNPSKEALHEPASHIAA